MKSGDLATADSLSKTFLFFFFFHLFHLMAHSCPVPET